jgi:hypothetical protein
MLLNPRLDTDVFDEIVSVTIARADGSLSVIGAKAIAGGVSTRELYAGGMVGLQPTDKTFLLYADTLEDYAPQIGDVITENDGTENTVLFFTTNMYGGLPVTYRAVARMKI